MPKTKKSKRPSGLRRYSEAALERELKRRLDNRRSSAERSNKRAALKYGDEGD